MAKRRRRSRSKSKVVCKRIKGQGMRRVKILASGKWRFMKGKCR